MSLADGDGIGLSILVIEDDADTAESCAALLRLSGHYVRIARDGPAALQLATEAAPDVALIDIGLPGMDGYTVARRMFAQSPERRPLLVAVSGFGQQADRERSRAAGIDLHLVKPVDPEQLFGLLRRFAQVIAPTAPASVSP